MAHEKELESYCVEIPAKADYHRFLIGKKGANVQKVRKMAIASYHESLGFIEISKFRL